MYIKVDSLKDITDEKYHGRVIAGGTDLMPLLHLGAKPRTDMIDISGIAECKTITSDETAFTIGACVTLAQIAENDGIRKNLPALAESAQETASPQIRNTATIGGNIMQDRRCIYFNQSREWRSSFPPCFKTGGDKCHQIPNSKTCKAIYYSDTATALLLYDAEVEMIEDGKPSVVPIGQLIARHSERNGLVEKNSDFIITAIRVKKAPLDEKSGFFKHSVRASIDFPLVNFAVRLPSEERCAKVVAGAVGAVPVELEETATLLDENISDVERLTEAAFSEIKKKAGQIRESVVSPKVKVMSYKLIAMLLDRLAAKA